MGVEKRYQEELALLSTEEYIRTKERVFDFLELFKKTNPVTILANNPAHPNSKVKSTVTKHKDEFRYQKWYLKRGNWIRGTEQLDQLEFRVSDDDAEWYMQNLYCAYRKSELRELMANSSKGVGTGQQLSLF